MAGNLLFIPLTLVVGIVQGFQFRVHIQIQFELALFKGVQLLHIGVNHHFRRTDFLQSRIGTEQGVGAVTSVKDAAGNQQAQQKHSQIQKTMAAPGRLIVRLVETEAEHQEERSQNQCQEKNAQPIDGEGLTGIQSHGEQENRLRQSVCKGDTQTGKSSAAVNTGGEGILRAAGIHLERGGTHGLYSAGFIADADIAGKHGGGAGGADCDAADRNGEILKGNRRVLGQKGQGFPVPAVQSAEIQGGFGIIRRKLLKIAELKDADFQKQGKNQPGDQKEESGCGKGKLPHPGG